MGEERERERGVHSYRGKDPDRIRKSAWKWGGGKKKKKGKKNRTSAIQRVSLLGLWKKRAPWEGGDFQEATWCVEDAEAEGRGRGKGLGKGEKFPILMKKRGCSFSAR